LEVVSIYPNPTNNGSIVINTHSTIDAIQIISVNGQIINEIKNPVKLNETYALENLPKGFYLLKLIDEYHRSFLLHYVAIFINTSHHPDISA
jgi:hypothetical protein